MEDIIQEIAAIKKSKSDLLAKLDHEKQSLTSRLEEIDRAISEIGGEIKTRKKRGPNKTTGKKRTMSAAAKAKIAAAQKKRWAAFHAKNKKK